MKKSIVQACLTTLEKIEFLVPDYSYFRIKAHEEGQQDVVAINERLPQLNENDLV
jgi:hypothetical protein